MIIHPTDIKGVYRIELELLGDQRGYFTMVIDLQEIRKYYPELSIVMVKRSLTKEQGTIRGVHFQRAPKEEDKIVQCLKGKIMDVVVDLRPDSPTYRKWTSAELSEENKELLVVPKGCGHAFQNTTPRSKRAEFAGTILRSASNGPSRTQSPQRGMPSGRS